MKLISCLFIFILIMPAMAQSSKSVEVKDSDYLSKEQKKQLQAEEDQRVREEWDREESQAKEEEEKKREIDEQQAEENGPYQQSSQRTQ